MGASQKLIAISLASIALLAAVPAAASAGDHRVFQAPAARPTDKPDPNRHSYSVPEAPASPSCTEHFCVHWVDEGIDAPNLTDSNGFEDGDGVPDFVERVQKVAEHVHAIENEKLGWREPKPDGRLGGGKDKTDVYLAELGGSLFGYAAPDRKQGTKEHRLPRRLHGYLVLDNDYSRFEFPGTKPIHDLEVTFAHEYNHILQFGYDAYEDAWFAEATATWMEDQVYNGINDYLRYIHRWVHLYETPLTASSTKEYGSAVWNEWLTHRYGRAVVRRAWSDAIRTKPGGFAVATYNRAITEAGGPGFNRDFVAFARDLPEWRTGGVFREGPLYPDVSRQGSLPEDGQPVERRLNHTTFQLLRVHAPGGKAIRVTASAPRGTTAGLALVGRIGSERHGKVIARMAFKQHGGGMAVHLSQPGRFSRLTAVLVNADTSAQGFSARRLDWNYLTDMAPFRARARIVR